MWWDLYRKSSGVRCSSFRGSISCCWSMLFIRGSGMWASETTGENVPAAVNANLKTAKGICV